MKQSDFYQLSAIKPAHELSRRKKSGAVALLFIAIIAGGLLGCRNVQTPPAISHDGQPLNSGHNIRLGAMFIMSGSLEGYGRNAKNAIEIAIEEINNTGGIQGRKLEAVFKDEAPAKTGDKAALIAEELISNEKADFLIGPTSSGVAPAVSEVAKKHHTILLVPMAAADQLTGSLFHPYIFATLSNSMMHARSGANLAASKPYKRWMTVAPDYNYGHSSWEMFKTRLQELRPDVTIVGEAFPAFRETKDYTPYIKEILATKPDAVWSPLWGSDAVTFIRQAMKYDLFSKIKFFFPDAGALEVLMPFGKEMPKGLYISSRYFFTTPDSDMNRSFVSSYFNKFKEYPDYMAGEAYAAVYFLKAAVERAKSIDSDTIVRAVESEPLAWETPEGWKVMRAEDHSVVEDCVWGETGYSNKYEFAVMTNIQSIQGEEICRTKEELRQVRAQSKAVH